MGYADKLRRLCALRGLDQSELAVRVRLTKSSMSRILSGSQVPKLDKAYELAKALGVSLDYLVDDELDVDSAGQWVVVTEDELTILKLARRLGSDAALDRLLGVDQASGPRHQPSGGADNGS